MWIILFSPDTCHKHCHVHQWDNCCCHEKLRCSYMTRTQCGYTFRPLFDLSTRRGVVFNRDIGDSLRGTPNVFQGKCVPEVSPLVSQPRCATTKPVFMNSSLCVTVVACHAMCTTYSWGWCFECHKETRVYEQFTVCDYGCVPGHMYDLSARFML